MPRRVQDIDLFPIFLAPASPGLTHLLDWRVSPDETLGFFRRRAFSTRYPFACSAACAVPQRLHLTVHAFWKHRGLPLQQHMDTSYASFSCTGCLFPTRIFARPTLVIKLFAPILCCGCFKPGIFSDAHRFTRLTGF